MFDGISSQMWAIVFFVFVFLVFRQRQAFISLLKFRLRLDEPRRVEREAMPHEMAILLDQARPQLEGAGFQYAYTGAAAPIIAFDPRPQRFTDVYWHGEQGALAYVRLGEPYTGQAVTVEFLTVFADGIKLETMNRRRWALMAPDQDGYIFEDPCADTLEAQWEAHLHALARESAIHGERLGFDEADGAVAGALRQTFSHLESRGWLVEERPGLYRYTVKGAWLSARRQLREFSKVRDALKRPFQHGYTPDLNALRANEMAGFATSIELGAQPLPRWTKVALFAVTLALSVLLFGRAFSFNIAAALLLVLFVHESGHLLAMRAFGFRNLSMIFLPYFGALATGHKTHVKPWQETIILLAGPVPGLIAVLFLSQMSMAGMSQAATEFWRMVFWFSLLINLFNLLPVGILDGGKLFKLAVLSRFPWVGAFFWTAGTAIALVYSLVNGLIVLALAMGLLLLSVRNQFRSARAITAIRAAARADGKSSMEKEEVVTRLGRYLAQPVFNEATVQGWAKRNAIAVMAYPRLLQGVLPFSSAAGVLTAHAASFFVPLLAAAWLVQQPVKPPLLRAVPYAQTEAGKLALEKWKRNAAVARDKFMVQYRATRDPQTKWDMLEQASDPDESAFDLDRKWLDQEHESLLPRLPKDHPARLWPLVDEARRDGPHAQARLLSVISLLGHGDGARITALDAPRFAVICAAWRALARHATPSLAARQDVLLEDTWKQLQAASVRKKGKGNMARWRESMLASAAAHLVFAGGNSVRATEWMTRRSASSTEKQRLYQVDVGWFLIDAGHSAQALALARRALDDPQMPHYWREGWLGVAGWAEMALNEPKLADAYFSAAMRRKEEPGPRREGAAFNVATWLLDTIQGRGQLHVTAKPKPRITNAMLGRLAALQVSDPQRAAHFRAGFADLMTVQWKKNVAPYMVRGDGSMGGWGRLRMETLTKLLDVKPAAL